MEKQEHPAAASLSRFKPMGDNVAVILDDPKEKVGMIHIPDAAQEPTTWGFVYAVGRDVTELKFGDRVLVKPTQGTAMIICGAKVIVVPEPKIEAKEKEEDAVV